MPVMSHRDAKHIDDDAGLMRQGVLHPPAKRSHTHSSIDSSVPSRATSQMSQHSYESRCAHHHLDDDDDDDDNLTTCLARSGAKLRDHMTNPGQTKTATTATLTTMDAGADSSGVRDSR
jgi:hypothetical protein